MNNALRAGARAGQSVSYGTQSYGVLRLPYQFFLPAATSVYCLCRRKGLLIYLERENSVNVLCRNQTKGFPTLNVWKLVYLNMLACWLAFKTVAFLNAPSVLHGDLSSPWCMDQPIPALATIGWANHAMWFPSLCGPRWKKKKKLQLSTLSQLPARKRLVEVVESGSS